VALAKGEAGPDECPTLCEETRRGLRGGSNQGDWRESLLAELRKEVAAPRLANIAAGLGAELKAGPMKATSFARECEEPLRLLFDNDPRPVEQALQRLGGLRQEGTPAPVA